MTWHYLLNELQPDIALLQECVPPEALGNGYNILYQEIGGNRKWGNAIVTKGTLTPVAFGNSQPGAVIVAEVSLGPEIITAISVYGAFCQHEYVTTTMHHILSDLTHILHGQKSQRTFVLGGDYNVSTQWDERYNHRDPSHKLVLDRIEDFGLVDCTGQYFKGHVQTNRHSRSGFPWQNDYIHVLKQLAKRLSSCQVIDNDQVRAASDHNPVLAYF